MNRYPHMVHEYYVGRLREIARRRRERIARLKTRGQAESYVRRARSAVRRSFGPFPKRTPLNPRVTGRDEYRGYVLEKIVFESRPEFLVTGNLYLPRGPARRRPCVLGLCGHSDLGKAYEPYQSFCQGLALKGFAVFIIDPIAQGERRQYYAGDGGRFKALTASHVQTGNQMALVGDFLGQWRVWDAIRALDYLLSRPEVDGTRLGVTGCSGGGTLTTYTTALDPRPTMAAPDCYVTSYLANMENELPADSEQNTPGILASGLDEVDMLLAYAPRPTIILAQRDDFFDERYTRQAFEDLKRVHRLLWQKDSARYSVGPGTHGYHRHAREAMYGFFMEQAGVKGSPGERGVSPVEERRLFATPRGETYPADSRRAFEFTADAARALARQRGKRGLSGRQVAESARKLLGVPKVEGPPHYRALVHAGGTDAGGHRFVQFAVETEPGIQAIVTAYGDRASRMHPPSGHVALYVGHLSGQEDVSQLPELHAFLKGRTSLVTVDPRGLGQSMARTCGSKTYAEVHGSDFLYASAGEMLGESYLGRRVYDVLRTIDFLAAREEKKGQAVDLLGRGHGSIIAAFAALLHPSRPRARIWDYLPSYHLLTRTPRFTWPLSSLLRSCLREFDLPDVYRALGRRLVKSKPWGPDMKPLAP